MNERVVKFFNAITGSTRRLLGHYHPQKFRQRNLLLNMGFVLLALVIITTAVGWYWSQEPEPFDVLAIANEQTMVDGRNRVSGYVTTATLVKVASTLLNKPGGYLSNDMVSPAVFIDNMPNWEFGVLVQVRDMARILRNDFSRSQSQSVEDVDLIIAEPKFNFDSESWLFPATESEYREGLEALESYLHRLNDADAYDAQFYTRADNLTVWLGLVEKRLGSLSQRLSASVGQVRINTDLAGDAMASQSTRRPAELVIQTPWLELDDVFYEARGSAWALLHLLKAVEVDFANVLEKKNAVVSLRQIIRELEATQEPIWSPVILNGKGFGLVANHSLVMASYISRANAAIIDLKALLTQG